MHSCKFYLSKNIDDLRRELASRDLPTEGLKKDLAWRLASLDDAHDYYSTSGSSSIISNQENLVARIQGDNVPTTEVRRRAKKSSSSPVGLSLGSVHVHHDSNSCRHVSSLARFSITFTKGLISILLIVVASCALWHNISAANKECFNRSIKNCYDFLSSNIKLIFGQLLHDCHFIWTGIQTFGAFKKRIRISDHPLRTFEGARND